MVRQKAKLILVPREEIYAIIIIKISISMQEKIQYLNIRNTIKPLNLKNASTKIYYIKKILLA